MVTELVDPPSLGVAARQVAGELTRLRATTARQVDDG